MRKLLGSSNDDIVKDAAWTISNIAAGNSNQIQTLIESGVMEDVYYVLLKGECHSRKEAACIISNVASCGTIDQISYLIENVKVLEPYYVLMNSKYAHTVSATLNGLENILKIVQADDKLLKFTTVSRIRNAFFVKSKLI